VGNGPDTCWFRSFSRAFRADVTAIVTGDGIYTVTVGSGPSLLAQGASLVVVYAAPAEKARTIVIKDGNDVVRIDDLGYGPPTILSQRNTLDGFIAADAGAGTGVEAKTTFIVGDGQAFSERLSFAAGGGTATFDNSLEGSDGPLWDTGTHDV